MSRCWSRAEAQPRSTPSAVRRAAGHHQGKVEGLPYPTCSGKARSAAVFSVRGRRGGKGTWRHTINHEACCAWPVLANAGLGGKEGAHACATHPPAANPSAWQCGSHAIATASVPVSPTPLPNAHPLATYGAATQEQRGKTQACVLAPLSTCMHTTMAMHPCRRTPEYPCPSIQPMCMMGAQYPLGHQGRSVSHPAATPPGRGCCAPAPRHDLPHTGTDRTALQPCPLDPPPRPAAPAAPADFSPYPPPPGRPPA